MSKDVAIIRGIADNLFLSGLASVVLDNPKFAVWAGAAKQGQHHCRKGGLAEHTREVIELSLLNNAYFSNYKKVPENKLFLAALFHDSGKMWDYEPTDDNYTDWRGTKHKEQIYHISRSALVWKQAQVTCGFIDDEDEVLHAILAHHGRREWGSPVTPQSRMAWLLHLSDSISARLDDCGLIKAY